MAYMIILLDRQGNLESVHVYEDQKRYRKVIQGLASKGCTCTEHGNETTITQRGE
jgi:hypothetical protein